MSEDDKDKFRDVVDDSKRHPPAKPSPVKNPKKALAGAGIFGILSMLFALGASAVLTAGKEHMDYQLGFALGFPLMLLPVVVVMLKQRNYTMGEIVGPMIVYLVISLVAFYLGIQKFFFS